MNFNQTKILFILLFIFGAISTKANSDFRIYSVVRGSRLFVTNYDVTEFIELSTLSDSAMINLFNSNNRDYNAYSTAKANFSKARYQDGIKKLGYIKMVEMYATRSRDKSTWKAFKITESDFYKEIERRENEALKELLATGKGIKFARAEFGKQLREAGFPHYSDKSDTDIYFDWYELQKKRIKLDFLLKEVSRFEYVSSTIPKAKTYIMSREVYDFASDVTTLATNSFDSKRLTSAQAAKMISEDPRLSVMIKDLAFIGADSTNISTLKSTAPAVYRDFLSTITNDIVPTLNTKVQSDIQRYVAIANKFANDYTPEELEEKAKENQNLFVSNKGDYNNLMLSKLYELAIEAQASQKSLEEAEVAQYAETVSKKASELLSSTAFIESEEAKSLRLEDWLVKSLRIQTGSNKDASSYRLKFESVARWVIKFQIKKAALNTTPQTILTLHEEKEWDTLKRVESYLAKVEYDENLKQFKTRELLNYFDGMITLNLTGNDERTDRETLALFFE
jgi:hypothetical protein